MATTGVANGRIDGRSHDPIEAQLAQRTSTRVRLHHSSLWAILRFFAQPLSTPICDNVPAGYHPGYSAASGTVELNH